MPDEVALSGGRVTAGVVRVGDTVRRPPRENSSFVRALLRRLEDGGFAAAPQYLGRDDQGRDILTYLPGIVPPDLDAAIPDETLVAAAALIKRYHDTTAGSVLARAQEVVCHNDLSPCNFVFRDGRPVGIIDFDTAAPGRRLQDVGYALFLWLCLGTGGPDASEQARRIGVFCDAYAIEHSGRVVEAIVSAVAANVEHLRSDGRHFDAEWWQEQLDWIRAHRDQLAPVSLYFANPSY